MQPFWQLFVLALLVEAVIETFKPLWEPEKRTFGFFASLVGGILAAVVINYLAGLDLFAWLGVPLSPAIAGVLLTGVLISRGSNFVHDLIAMALALKERLRD